MTDFFLKNAVLFGFLMLMIPYEIYVMIVFLQNKKIRDTVPQLPKKSY